MTTDSELLERITVRADVFGGKPIIRDMRIAVEHVLGMLAAGDPAETILDEYPDLEPEDIQACLESSGGQVDKVAHLPELRFAVGEPDVDTTTIDNAAAAGGGRVLHAQGRHGRLSHPSPGDVEEAGQR